LAARAGRRLRRTEALPECVRELGSKQHNLRRIIDPYQKDYEAAESAERGRDAGAPQIPTQQELADDEQHGRNRAAKPDVLPVDLAIGQIAEQEGEKYGDNRCRDRKI